MTLIQRRTPQAIMGRVSAAVEVVMATPQAVSLAVGALLVVVLGYRQIFVIMAVVTAVAAAYIAVTLRDQIADDVRRAPAADLEPAGRRRAVLPTTPLEPLSRERPRDTCRRPGFSPTSRAPRNVRRCRWLA